MTASLFRRLTDLGSDAEVRAICASMGHPGLRRVAPESLLDTVTLLRATGPDQAPTLAEAMRRVAEAAGRHQFTAIISERQAGELAAQSTYGEHVLSVILQAARQTPLPQRVKDFSKDAKLVPGDPGGPWGVVRIVDGEPLKDRTVRRSGRRRRAMGWTVSADAAALVGAEADRRGVSQSELVEEILVRALS